MWLEIEIIRPRWGRGGWEYAYPGLRFAYPGLPLFKSFGLVEFCCIDQRGQPPLLNSCGGTSSPSYRAD
jgi:hypothetical protein